MSTQRFDDFVVAGAVQDRAVEPVPTHHGTLRSHHLTPCTVVANDTDDRKVEANSRVELETIEAERTVAVHDDDALVRVGELCRQRERHADAQRAERTRVHPCAATLHGDDLCRRCNNVAAIPDHDRLTEGAEPVAHFLAHALGIDRRFVAVKCRLNLRFGGRLKFSQLREPCREVQLHALVLHLFREQVEATCDVANERHVGLSVLPHQDVVHVELNHLGVVRNALAKAHSEVEQGAGQHDAVRLRERVPARAV